MSRTTLLRPLAAAAVVAGLLAASAGPASAAPAPRGYTVYGDVIVELSQSPKDQLSGVQSPRDAASGQATGLVSPRDVNTGLSGG